MAVKHCEWCSDKWGTVARLFSSEDDFKKSKYYGGGDTIINDENGVTVAVWPGKHNVGRNVGNYWLCSPVHPNCGCSFKEHNFGGKDEGEDWYSKLDFSDLD